MTTPAQIAALAERVEKLDGPDIGVDWDIGWALGEWINLGGWWREHKKTGDRERFSPSMGAPTYTASLDAAMTLVPEGWHVGYLTECDENNAPHCCLTENAEPCRDAVGDGADMALSLAAAALRARAQQEPSDGE